MLPPAEQISGRPMPRKYAVSMFPPADTRIPGAMILMSETAGREFGRQKDPNQKDMERL